MGFTGAFNHDKFNSCVNSAVGISTGWCKSGCLECTAPAQADLPSCTGVPNGSLTPCMESTAVSCSSADQAIITGMDSNDFGDKQNTCGTQSYNIFTGAFNHDKFNSCVNRAVGISTVCSDCYATTGEYAAKNCKAKCITGWCKSGCLECTAPAQADLPSCTGVSNGSPTPCMESTAVSCSSADQAIISGMDSN